MASYRVVLNRQILRELEARTQRFVAAYRPGLPSVALLPGGMGSRLFQSLVPYRSGEAFPDFPGFRLIWVSLTAVLAGELAQVRLRKDERDAGSRPMIPIGELGGLIRKYDGTARHFRALANYFTYGYDWRRSNRRAAEYFRELLVRIRAGVMSRHGEDPLPNLMLLGHSQGGMVAKLFIDDVVARGEEPRQWFRRFVSAGTPFYGNHTHVHRYYVGDKLPNKLIQGGAPAVAELTGTLPGPYALLPAPRDVLEPRLGALGLTRYPVRDLATDQAVDPFGVGTRNRYPNTASVPYLQRAADEMRALARPIPAPLRDAVFHIRSNTGGPGPLMLTWRKVKGATFDPTGPSPIRDDGGGSDGTVPAWSSRLAETPRAQVFDFEGVAHADMVEHPAVLELLTSLLDDPAPVAPGAPRVVAPGPPSASDDEIDAVIRRARSGELDESELLSMPGKTLATFQEQLSFD